MISQLKDDKIERVISVLNVPRQNIHFIENYHGPIEDKEFYFNIDYEALKVLSDIVQVAEQYIVNYYNRSTSCVGCF